MNERQQKMLEAIKLSEKLVECSERKVELLRKLNRSLEIQAVWPEAFKDGQKCSFCGAMRMLPRSRETAHTVAYLKREDGERYYLSREEFKELRPGLPIHPEYKEGPDAE